MKVRASVGKMCKHCRVISRRNGSGKRTVRVICPVDPKHKQRQK